MNHQILEYRAGRNYIRVGDTVHIKPTRPRKRNGFDAKVVRIDADDTGQPVAVHVYDPERRARVLPPERITRRHQTNRKQHQ